MLSKIISRIPIKGGIVQSAGSADATKVTITDTDGKLYSSVFTAGGGGGTSANLVTFNPVYTNSTLDHALTGESGPSPGTIQDALQEIDLQKLQYDKNLSDIPDKTAAFNNIKKAATTSVAGVVELASNTETEAGTDTATDTGPAGNPITAKLAVPPSAAVATFVKKSGDTMSGALTLPNGNPTNANHAAHKSYVDTSIATAIANTTNIPTGNIVWVDKINGNNSTGLRGRIDKPFLTLAAAKAAASSGDTIFVLPGTYDERDLLKNGVNWYFMPGAKIAHTSNVSGGIWDDGASYGTNDAVTCIITGYGDFRNASNVNNPASVFDISNAGSNIYVECQKMSNLSTGSAVIKVSAGTTKFIIRENIAPDNSVCLNILGGTNLFRINGDLVGAQGIYVTAGTTDLYVKDIIATLKTVDVNGSGAVLRVFAKDMTSSTNTTSAINVVTGSLEVDARLISGTGSQTILATGGIVKIMNAKIKNTKVSSSALAINIENPVTLTLKDTDLEVDAGTTNTINNTAEADTVYLHGYNRGNKAKGSNITFTYGVYELVS